MRVYLSHSSPSETSIRSLARASQYAVHVAVGSFATTHDAAGSNGITKLYVCAAYATTHDAVGSFNARHELVGSFTTTTCAKSGTPTAGNRYG